MRREAWHSGAQALTDPRPSAPNAVVAVVGGGGGRAEGEQREGDDSERDSLHGFLLPMG